MWRKNKYIVENTSIFFLGKETNFTLSFIKSRKKQLGEKLENTATKVLGSNHAHDSLNKVCFDIDKKNKTYYCVGADNNNVNGKSGCCYAVVDKLCK
tara:strand:- start:143 stop:433 length:291 start_codon:yes stop_codon:yes gene_type:complete